MSGTGVHYNRGYDQGFEDGRESMAEDIAEFLKNYEEDDSVPVEALEDILDYLLGFEPETDDNVIQEVIQYEPDD